MSKETIRKLIRFLMANLVIAILIIGSFILNAFYENKSSEAVPTEEKTQNVAQQPVETQKTIAQPTGQPTIAATPTIETTNQTVATTSVETETPTAVTAQPNLNSQTVTNQLATSTLSRNTITTTQIPTIQSNTNPNITKTEPTKTVDATAIENNKICVSMGPFTLEEKATLDFILKKNNQSDLANISKKLTHQIVWNLGTNKTEAETLFKKQKEGAMSDPKFVLLQNNKKEWIVHIVKVPGSEVVAEKLTKELGEKAQKINAGGKWEYITLPEGYYVIFENYDLLKDTTIKSIDIMLKPNKEPC